MPIDSSTYRLHRLLKVTDSIAITVRVSFSKAFMVIKYMVEIFTYSSKRVKYKYLLNVSHTYNKELHMTYTTENDTYHIQITHTSTSSTMFCWQACNNNKSQKTNVLVSFSIQQLVCTHLHVITWLLASMSWQQLRRTTEHLTVLLMACQNSKCAGPTYRQNCLANTKTFHLKCQTSP